MEEDEIETQVDGARVELVPGGRLVRGPDGRFLPGTVTPRPITRENSHEYQRRYREKIRARLRRRIRDVTTSREGAKMGSSSEAIAEAGAMLWEEIVLNPDAYPRDRVEAFVKLGALLGIQVEPGSSSEAEENRDVLAGLGREGLRSMLAKLRAGSE